MASFAEWSNKKKKEREESQNASTLGKETSQGPSASKPASFGEWSNQKKGITYVYDGKHYATERDARQAMTANTVNKPASDKASAGADLQQTADKRPVTVNRPASINRYMSTEKRNALHQSVLEEAKAQEAEQARQAEAKAQAKLDSAKRVQAQRSGLSQRQALTAEKDTEESAQLSHRTAGLRGPIDPEQAARNEAVRLAEDQALRDAYRETYGEDAPEKSAWNQIKLASAANLSGLTKAGQGIINTADFLVNLIPRTLEDTGLVENATDNPVSNFMRGQVEMGQRDAETWDREVAKYSAAQGTTAGKIARFQEMVMQNAPQTVIDLMKFFSTGGASAAAALGAPVQGVLPMVQKAVKELAKKPDFWYSFITQLGNNYQEALNQGADNDRATVAALTASLANAEIEVGGISGEGGLETLLQKIGGGQGAMVSWLLSLPEEGLEEVLQGITTRATNAAMFNGDTPLYGQGGVFDKEAAKEEFGSGMAVAAVLGGAQIGANTIYNKVTADSVREQAMQQLFDTLLSEEQQSAAPTQPVTETQESTAPDRATTQMRMNQVQESAAALGESGSRALTAAYDEGTAQDLSAEDAYAGFTAVYNAKLNGQSMTEQAQQAAAKLPEHMRMAAESAAENDSIRASQAKYFGENAGLDRKDAMTKRANLSSKTMRLLDAVGKAAGVQVRFAETVAGGMSNASYENGVVTIALDTESPVQAVFTHEIVHRIREVSPESYGQLAQFVTSNMHQMKLRFAQASYGARYEASGDLVTEEIVADAIGFVLSDSKMVNKLVQENRSLAQRIADGIHDFVAAINRVLEGQNVKLTSSQKFTFRELEGQLDEMGKLLGNALKTIDAQKSAGQATKNATQEGDVKSQAKNSRKADREYAPVFYSQMAKVIEGSKQEKLGAASVVPMLKGKGVKAEEIKWSGIEQFLEGKKSVTKQELQEFARNSQLQIEEETLYNKEIPYTDEQNAKIAEYTEKHRAVMDNLAAEWERIVGSEFPLDRAANVNSDDIDRQIKEAAATNANDTPEGLRHKELQGKIRAMIEANDYFGYDRMGQPYRSIVWNPESFIRNYEMSEEDANLIREFAESKRTMDEIRARAEISEQDVHKLKSIANNAAAYYRKVTDVKSEHYAENAKRMSKWGQYKLDGGENYREYLFKMPGSDYSNQAMAGHWGNERHGVLAHARVQDFDTANGKMLFIEEIQSDWHNEGAKQGYADEESKGFTELTLGEYEVQSNGVPIAEVRDAYDNIYAYVMKVQGKYVVDFGNGNRFDSFLEEADAMSALKAQAQYDVGTPDAPFRKNYHEFVLKNLLRKAAEDGYDSIGWTTADLQSERWSDEYAEGYRIEYDQDIPKFLNKYGKKWGAKVGITKLPSGDTVWSMDITDAMRESVLYEGQPKYSLKDSKDQALELSDANTRYSLREKAPPKKTGVAYKVFYAKDGQLYPPMVANPGGAGTPVGVWLDADIGAAAAPSKTGRAQVQAGGKGTNASKGSLAFRPGWHLGDIPQAKQFARKNPETGKKDLFPADFVWAECEYAMDHDYQEEAMSYGYTENGKFRHSYAGLPKLPVDGYYRYRTNPNPDTVPWVITGAMKVTRILTDEETDALCRAAGVEPMKRQGGPIDLSKYGLKAGDTTQFSLKSGDEGATFEENGVKYSLKSLRHDITEGRMFDDLVTAKVFNQKEADLLKQNLDKLVSYMLPNANILDMNEEYGKGNRPYSAYKPNSDPLYVISLDFSTLCRKRLMTQYVIEQLQLRENRPMTAEEQIAIRSMLLDYRQQEQALQVACAMCYVEAARLKAPKQMERFFNDTEAIMRKYFAKKDKAFNDKVKEAQAKFKRDHGYDENATKKDMSGKDTKALNEMSARMRKEYTPDANQQAIIDKAKSLPRSTFLTAGNLTALAIDQPDIYAAYTDHIRASTRSKSLESDIPYYYGDSQGQVSDTFIDSVNAENGMRFDSWSDFQMKHMLDMITAVIDLSVRGSKMHGYTKFPEMVRIFGKTGMMFNLSGVTEGNGFDANGNLLFSSTEGIDIVEARKLLRDFPETAGLQCIGVSDDHVRALLRADYVDYVIPYHTSGMNATLRKMAGINAWKDYTSTQHARKDPKAKKPANADKWQVEPVWSEFYVPEGKNGLDIMRNTAQRYIDMCHERGLIPKFDQFMDEPGYWKLLVDRKMINQVTGEIVEQKPVKPIFDFDLIKQEIDREVSQYDPQLEKRALKYVVDNFDAVHQRIRDLKKGHPKKPMLKMANEILQAYAEGSKGPEPGKKYSKKGGKEIAADIQRMVEQYGQIEAGEKPFREATLPKKTAPGKNVSQTVRTVLEAEATPEIILPDIYELASEGHYSFESITDKQAIQAADAKITDRGWAGALAEWTKTVAAGKVSKENTATGWALYNHAANAGDTKAALEILDNMVLHQRSAAQALQATRILKNLTPEAQLYNVTRSVKNLQEELDKRYGEKHGFKVEINENLAERFLQAQTDKTREEVLTEIYRDIGRQMPSRFMDKWNAWRYLAMLGNPRTHVRNIVGNAGFAPVVAAKNVTATGIEAMVNFVSRGKTGRTKSVITGATAKDRALLGAAWADYAKAEELILAGGKYDDLQRQRKEIEAGRVIFKTNPLEAARRFNSAAMDQEDSWFAKPHYAAAMAGYCKANGITPEQIAKDGAAVKKAREYAVKEAQKATYRDTNALSQAFSDIGGKWVRSDNPAKKAVGHLVEGILPFRKTPANILARGLEYSPLGIIKGVSEAVRSVKSEEITPAQAIDSISAGLTGTGLLALGFWLASMGLVRGHGSDDEKERGFEELSGHQSYSMEIGNDSYTLDWLAPECLPFFVGVNLYDLNKGKEETNVSTVLNSMTTLTEPMLEMSCLQSLNDLIDSVGYASSNDLSGLVTIAASAATSYITQAFPTLLGQIERSGEAERMTSYTDKNNRYLTTDMQYTIGKVSAKLPGWDFSQIPYIDAWGRTESSGKVGTRVVNNMLNPSYTSTIVEGEMEEELLRLYMQTDESVFPSRAAKYFNVDGERKDLTAEEYVKYATLKGQTSYEVVSELLKSKAYKGMNDEKKAKAVEDSYTLANQLAKSKISDYAPDSWVVKAMEAKKSYNIPYSTFVAVRAELSDLESLKDADGDTITDSLGLLKMEAIYNMKGLTDKQRQALFQYMGVGKNVIHYNPALVKQKLAVMRKKAQ